MIHLAAVRNFVCICFPLCAIGCGGSAAPFGDSGAEPTGTATLGETSADAGETETGASEATGAGEETGTDDSSHCTPGPLLVVDEIPDLPSLSAVNEDTLAAFEVDGDALIGKFVRDAGSAEEAMKLWQELVLRIPTNQRLDIVQFNIFGDTDPVAWVDGTGTGNQVGRYGFTIAFSAENFTINPGGSCAPLSGRRGTYDWSLIHEFHHIRGRADGSVDDFTFTFQGPTGDGAGYPEDGTPVLDRDFVTSYAERAGGDEDAAETFTAYMMLPEVPAPADALATTKVRWFDQRPGYPELRTALRISEPDGSADEIQPAPRAEFPFELTPPAWTLGTWRGVSEGGVEIQYQLEPDNITTAEIVGGVETNVTSYMNLRDDGSLVTLNQYEVSESFYFFTRSQAGKTTDEAFSPGPDAQLELEHGDLGFVLLQQVAAH